MIVRALQVVTYFAALLVLAGGSLAEEANESPSPSEEMPSAEEEAAAKEAAILASSLESLRALCDSIDSKETEISSIEEAISGAESEPEKEPLIEQSKRLRLELEELESQFEVVASAGVDVSLFEDAESEPVDLQTELVKLLQPLVDEAKKVTEASREIEELKADLIKYGERKDVANRAIGELEKVLGETSADAEEDEQVRERITNKTLKVWRGRLKEADNQFTVTSHQLETKSANQRPLLETTREMALKFFRSRGVNLLFGIAAFFAVYGFLRFIYRQLQRFVLSKRGGRTFGGRLLDVLYQIFVFIAALFAMIMVFYIANDLVLLGLTLLFVAGISWGGAKFLPGYLEQVRLMLNLGPVKERERLVFDGLPWRLDTLNFQCLLVNPALDGGTLRLPVKSLIGMYSRPCVEDESWFPCSTGDWVKLESGPCGKVLWQTMEMVCVEPLGKAPITFQTADFLQRNPQNLTGGFRISTEFGIDYKHQTESTTTIPRLMEESLRRDLSEIIDTEWIHHIGVEIGEAAASSINYEIDVDVSGEAASSYETVERALTKILIDACNENGWSIPFTQIQLHQASNG